MILILGYGKSGQAAAKFCKSLGKEVCIFDEKLFPEEPPLASITQVILSPGINPSHPILQKARRHGIEIISEIELGLRHVKQKVVGVTGSNGKTSTVLLMEHILAPRAKALGNIGEPFTEYLLAPQNHEWLILELSSFQLETTTTNRLDMAFLLNIFPNHLDRYQSIEEYGEAKLRIAELVQSPNDFYVSEQVYREFKPIGNVFEKNLAPINGLEYIDLKMPSKQSVQAAYLLCKRCGVTDVEFLERLKTFRKPQDRIELVAKIKDVAYYNDSKSSNVQATLHAVERFKGPLILIVGGVHKGSSYRPWREFSKKVRKMICYGKAAPIIECELASHMPLEVVGPFEEAVKLAKDQAKAGDTVLLSPGCSSYDQFENYQQRGRAFKRLVGEL